MQPITALAHRLAGRQSTEWQKNAACRHLDPDLFFPEGTLGGALLQIREAKRVCGGCPVRVPCLRWALTTGQDAGIWGGMTEEERRRVARSRSLGQPCTCLTAATMPDVMADRSLAVQTYGGIV